MYDRLKKEEELADFDVDAREETRVRLARAMNDASDAVEIYLVSPVPMALHAMQAQLISYTAVYVQAQKTLDADTLKSVVDQLMETRNEDGRYDDGLDDDDEEEPDDDELADEIADWLGDEGEDP